MKKYICLFIFSFLGVVSFAQPQNKGYFVVKGKVLREQSLDTLNTSLTCYVALAGAKRLSVPIAKDGVFEQKIETEGNQNFYFEVGDFYLTFYIKPNDTLFISYDKNNIANTFSVKGNSTKRTNELNFNYQFSKEFFSKRMALMEKLNNEITRTDSAKASDSVRVSWVNDEYNQEYNFISKDTSLSKEMKKLLQDESYFYWTNDMTIRIFLNRMPEFMKYELIAGSNKIILKDTKFYEPKYRTLNLDYFYSIPEYRDFLSFFTGAYAIGIHPPQPYWSYDIGIYKDSANRNGLETEYYSAMAFLPFYSIRDWYVTNFIFKYFKIGMFPFEDVEKVMMDFLPICQNEDYKNKILDVYNSSKKYIPGKPAPDFTLKDVSGKDVSLSDFKGKVVLLDFWGVHCGPCILDLQNTTPKVHEKYKGKNVVFINICVEDTEDNWKEAIKKYNVQGVNLFAKGWTDNPVCKAFGIEPIPHYILIDKNGNYADYQCPIYSLLSDNNILDKVLLQ